MATPQPARAKAFSQNRTKELDIYAAEFAKLVNRHSPSRTDDPSQWLRRIPNEAFRYYRRGISTFGSKAHSPIERRGRLYLIHTALLFMWMSWGKATARERFQTKAEQGTRRTASLVTLEDYRRAGVVAHYETDNWFFQPVGQWSLSIISGAIRTEKIDSDKLKASVQNQTTINCDVRTLSLLEGVGAIPSRDRLSLD